MPKAHTETIDAVALADRLRPILLPPSRELRREARAEGISPSQVTLLAVIKYTPGIGVKELAERERVSAPAMSRHVDRLVKAGAGSRGGAGEAPRRGGGSPDGN